MKKTVYFLFTLILTISCKNNGVVHNDPIPEHESLTITSKFVNEDRIINIWTPPNYSKSNDSLPVLYMPDGGVKEDFPHIANTVAKLIKANKIPPIMVVGIENTERKRDLTGPTEVEEDKKVANQVGQSANFRNFIKNELIPEITTRYRTKDKIGIIGESLAGLFVVETLELEPNIFDFYIAMDPALWWNNQFLVKNAADNFNNNSTEKEIKFWFAGSSVQKETPFITELSTIIKNQKPKNLIWKYSDEPNEEHSTIYRATKEKALIWIFKE